MSAHAIPSLRETQLAAQQDMLAKVQDRRNHMVAEWAAKAMGKSNADVYSHVLNAANGNDEKEIAKQLRSELAQAGVALTINEIRACLEEMLDQAALEVSH
ncbi:ATPase inhibitor subunit zeta [Rhizobium halophytocola]|uniref:DUF1476 family protein n=1 Tax=Rhizobium halophytocola TaxID=735519 RepID=A0ABS4DXU4_9HYPH|nr:ATPase inhibitor subunit zeta [Rhizobium halophytocola]MBP1850514.1 hypothetical protein [Rhizobium halophytocola]